MVYEYYARTERVIDGDSIVLSLNLGYDMTKHRQHTRILDVNTAELRPASGAQYPAAIRHRNFVMEWLIDAAIDFGGDWPLIFDSQEWSMDSFGRALGYVTRRSDGRDLSADLLEEFGDAITY